MKKGRGIFSDGEATDFFVVDLVRHFIGDVFEYKLEIRM